jgi:hypothetical protein
MSSEVGIAQGDTNNMGGSFNFPTALGEGEEVWVRGYLYFPAGFDFSASGQGLKTLRIHVKTSSGGNEGYHDVLINNGLTVGSEIGNPQFAPNNPSRNSIGQPITTGKWHAIEMYVKYSATPGKGVYRVWQNGNLIFEDKLTHTLRSSSSKADFIYLFTYWNGGAPKTQKAYVDDFIVTNQRPSNTDAHGNPYIGVSGTVSITPPPNPPSAIR